MFPPSNDDRRRLLQIARRAIQHAIIEKRILDLQPDFPTLPAPGGAFVTLHHCGRLRGCVGSIENEAPLADLIARVAIGAALHDSRFSPVPEEEIASLEIEISILSRLERIALESIRVGTHGLMIVNAASRGLLLPQVAAEQGWTPQRFLEETCVKAGLSGHAWRDPTTSIFAFTAEVFSEAAYGAIVKG